MSVAIMRSRPNDPKPGRKPLTFNYGDEKITVERVDRTSNVNRVLIKVHPDCRVLAHAPENSDDAQVLNAVKKRSRWISQQLKEFRAQLEHITPRHYISGESHLYLGKQYQLKVYQAEYNKEHVKLLRGTLEITVKEKTPDRIRALLSHWYKERARDVFSKRLDAVLEQALWVSDRPPISVRTMQTQWGSCSPSGRLTLNPHLVKAPRQCIDYVILHELCHIAEHNHSARFYRLMGQVMPRWEDVKARLDGMANVLLNV